MCGSSIRTTFSLEGAIADLKSVVERDRPDLVMCDFLMLRERTQAQPPARRGTPQYLPGPSGVTLNDRAGLVRGMLEAGQLHAWSRSLWRSLWGADLRFPVGKYFRGPGGGTPPCLACGVLPARAPRMGGYRQRAGGILASPSLKAEDMSRAMTGFAREFMARVPDATKESRFAIAYFCAKNFIGVARLLGQGKVPTTG